MCEGGCWGEVSLTDLRLVEGDKVTFLAVVEMESGAFEIVYEATVADGEMKGTVDFGDYGTGTFTGRRANSRE